MVFSDKERVNVVAEKLIREQAMDLIKSKASIEDIERHFLFVVSLAKEGNFQAFPHINHVPPNR